MPSSAHRTPFQESPLEVPTSPHPVTTTVIDAIVGTSVPKMLMKSPNPESPQAECARATRTHRMQTSEAIAYENAIRSDVV